MTLNMPSNSKKNHNLYHKPKNVTTSNDYDNYDKSNETEYSNNSKMVGYLFVISQKVKHIAGVALKKHLFTIYLKEPEGLLIA